MIDKNGIERCDFAHAHEDIVRTVMDRMPDEETLYDLAELFKVFGDSTRVKILCVLFEAEMCVCDIAELLSMSQSAISHQLRVLKQSKLVKTGGREKRFSIRWPTSTSAPFLTREWSI